MCSSPDRPMLVERTDCGPTSHPGDAACLPTGARAMIEPLKPVGRNAPLWPELLEHQLENFGAGMHICPIYSTPTDRMRVLVAFFDGALRHNEQCLYFADPDQANEVAQCLRDLGPSARAALDRGALVPITTREQFVRNGHFDPQAMFELQDALARRARCSGFSA